MSAKRTIGLVLASLLLVVTPACFTMHHTVGSGSSGGDEVEHRQWYVLWGLVPINPKDSQDMAGTATDYEVTTEWTALDVIINIFTGFLSFYSFTITVEK